MSWPTIDEAIVSLLTATDGLTIVELMEKLREMGAPYTFLDVERGLCNLCTAGKVTWCNEVHLQKRGVTG